jgi:tellurite resistance protein TerC
MSTTAGWIVFGAIVAIMLALDLGVFHRKSKEVTVREALMWSCIWVGIALSFNVAIYFWRGPQSALEFFTGYLIEKSLSLDNIFIFYVLFAYFKIAPKHQYRVLFWGIIGALVMRIVFVFAGIALLEKFSWIVYVFGAFLILTGFKMLVRTEEDIHPEQNPVLRLVRRVFPVTNETTGDSHFFVRQHGKLMATPLFVALVAVESTDAVFAADSIPAILAVTRDPFIVYTSNIFAILGLRALYFALSGMIGRFEHLHYGLGAILVFVGIKMILSDIVHLPPLVSLAIILGILGISILTSIRKKTTTDRKAA